MAKFVGEYEIVASGKVNDGISIRDIHDYLVVNSTLHAKEVLMGNDDYDDMFWVICQWDTEIIRGPYPSEPVKVETYGTGIKKFFAYRDFVMMDKDKNIIVKAKTKWLLLDKTNRRPIRIPGELVSLFDMETGYDQLNEEYKDRDVDFYRATSSQPVAEDIDENNHVNNTAYFDWIENGLKSTGNDGLIERIMISYKNEVLLLDQVDVLFSKRVKVETGTYLSFRIVNSKTNTINAYGRIFFRGD